MFGNYKNTQSSKLVRIISKEQKIDTFEFINEVIGFINFMFQSNSIFINFLSKQTF